MTKYHDAQPIIYMSVSSLKGYKLRGMRQTSYWFRISGVEEIYHVLYSRGELSSVLKINAVSIVQTSNLGTFCRPQKEVGNSFSLRVTAQDRVYIMPWSCLFFPVAMEKSADNLFGGDV